MWYLTDIIKKKKEEEDKASSLIWLKNKIEIPTFTEAKMWEWTTMNSWTMIKQAPLWAKPQWQFDWKSIFNDTITSQVINQKFDEINRKQDYEKRKGSLMAEYNNWTSNWKSWADFISTQTPEDKKTITWILEQQIQNNLKWPTISQAKDESISSKQYRKKEEQLNISQSNENLLQESWTAVVKWTQWMLEWLSWFGWAIRWWLMDHTKYSEDEIRNAEKYPVFLKAQHNIEKQTDFDISDLSTWRFWIDTLWSQVPYIAWWIWVWKAVWWITKWLTEWLNIGKIYKDVITLWGEAVGNTLYDSAITSWDTFNQLRDSWVSVDEASKWAREVFVRNMATVVTNTPQWIATMWKWNIFWKIPWIIKAWWNIWTQTIEEWYNSWLQRDVYNKITTWTWISFGDFLASPEWQEAMFWWAIWWWVFHIWWETINKISDIKNNKKIKDIQNQYNNIYNTVYDFAEKQDDTFLDLVDMSVVDWSINNKTWNKYKDIYISLKNAIIDWKIWDVIQSWTEKFAEFTWSKINLLGWENASKAPLSNLEIAKNMESSWKDNTNIWQKTWWEKWTEWKWKFEIDDSKAELIPQTQEDISKERMHYKISELLNHEELYDQYPEIKDIKFSFKNLWWEKWGFYDVLNKSIVLDTSFRMKF